jgi:hypothetical protein
VLARGDALHLDRHLVERRRHPCCLGPLRIPVAAYISTCLSTSQPDVSSQSLTRESVHYNVSITIAQLLIQFARRIKIVPTCRMPL